MTTGQALTAVKRMKVTMMSRTEMPLTLHGGEDDSSGVILAPINSDEEGANDRPNATRSGRAITTRSEIEFSFDVFLINSSL